MSVAREALFGAGYAIFLLAIAAGIKAIGRRAAGDEAAARTFPRRDVARFHHGMSLSIVLAADALLIAVATRHHRASEIALLGALVVIISGVLLRGFAAFHREGSRRG